MHGTHVLVNTDREPRWITVTGYRTNSVCPLRHLPDAAAVLLLHHGATSREAGRQPRQTLQPHPGSQGG